MLAERISSGQEVRWMPDTHTHTLLKAILQESSCVHLLQVTVNVCWGLGFRRVLWLPGT